MIIKQCVWVLVTTGCTKTSAVVQHSIAQAPVFEASVASQMEVLYKCTIYMRIYNKQPSYFLFALN